MENKITTEQAKRLLTAIFAEPEDEMYDGDEKELIDDNYPETTTEKVGYAEYVMTHDLQFIGTSIHRLSRLYNLLMAVERAEGGKLPDIITNNELRMALKPLLIVENDIKDIAEMLTEVYKATKPGEDGRDAT